MSRKGTRKPNRASFSNNAPASLTRGFLFRPVWKSRIGFHPRTPRTTLFQPVPTTLCPDTAMSDTPTGNSVRENSASSDKLFKYHPAQRTETRTPRSDSFPPVHTSGSLWHPPVEDGSYFVHMASSSDHDAVQWRDVAKPAKNPEETLSACIPIAWSWTMLLRESRDHPSLYNINEYLAFDFPTSHTTYPLIKQKL